MEVCLHAASRHTDRVLYPGFIINGELLWQHMDNLFARGQHELIHIFDKALDIYPANFTVVFTGKDTTVLDTFDMLACNPDVNHLNIDIGLSGRFFYRLPDTIDRFLDIGHDPPAYAG